MITIILITTVFVFLGTVLFLGLRGFVGRADVRGLSTRLKPVSIDAMRNLLDQEQDRYLASRLTPVQMRHIRRERAIVLIEYVWRIAQNAALALQASESLSRSRSREMAEKGVQIANTALRIRLLALYSLWFLTLSVVWPRAPLSINIVDGYSMLSFDIDFLNAANPTVAHP